MSLETALGGVPAAFRGRLIKSYKALKEAFATGQHDAAGLRAGRFCEVALRLLQHTATGSYTPFGTKITNFTNECLALEKVPTANAPESVRVILPRALNFLYTMRNKRGIGHEGDDVDANEIDSATCVRLADWCLCELMRLFHSLSLEEAQAVLDAIAEREQPDVWSVGGKKRVLRTDLNYREQALLLLYGETDPVPVEDLHSWIEHPRLADFRRHVLGPLHEKRLIEWDRETETATISPVGAAFVEGQLI